MTQEVPFAIQMEPVQGCNLGCDFCGIHSVGYERKAKGFDMMDPSIARSVAEQVATLGWNPRIEYAMHGEPTMHPDLPALIEPFRRALPGTYILVTSNGGGLLRDTDATVAALFEAGLDTLALDDYVTNKIVQRFEEQYSGPGVMRYPADKAANPHQRSKTQRVVIMQDLTTTDEGTHGTVHNSAGFAAPKDYSKNDKRCAKPFRELAVRWDGNVAICCNDWSGQFKVGNVMTEGLEAIWQHPRMQAARKALYHGRRDLLEPCNGCTATTYRNGLLPDKKGLIDLPFPTVDDQLTLAEAIDGPDYTRRIRTFDA